MKKQTTHNSHQFIANIIGSIGYIALIFIWLLVIQMVLLLFPSGSESFYSAVGSVITQDTGASQQATANNTALQFLLIIALAATAWGVAYYGTLAISSLLKKTLKIMKIKLTNDTLAVAKYTVVVVGLSAVALLLFLLTQDELIQRFAFAFLGFVAGIIAFGAFWLQNLIALRHGVRAVVLR